MKRIIFLLMLCVASEIDATKLIEAKNDEISTDISSITTIRAMLGIAVVLSDGSSLAGSPELIQACLPPNATFERFITFNGHVTHLIIISYNTQAVWNSTIDYIVNKAAEYLNAQGFTNYHLYVYPGI